jgi:hypothetical protein
LASAALAQAQEAVQLTFASAAEREVWVASDLPTARPEGTLSATGPSLEVPTAGVAAGDRLFVWNKETGNIAMRRIGDIQQRAWKLAPADDRLIGVVRIRVEHGGQPVAAGRVEVTDERRTQEQILDPEAKGIAEFFGVAPGDLRVSVTYRTEGRTAEPQRQSFEVGLERQRAEPTFVVALPDPVETEGAPRAPGAAPGEPAATLGIGDVLRRLVMVAIVLAIVGAAGYYAFQYLRNNQDSVKERLEKMGVQVPDPQADPDAAAPPPKPVAPVVQEKIILDDATPAATGAAAAPPPRTGGVPRLVRELGDAYEVPEGLVVVGREEGLPVSLPNESSISRRHAEIVRTGDEITIRDLGSTNGTFVNGEKIDGERLVHPGDEVQLGAVRFRLEA